MTLLSVLSKHSSHIFTIFVCLTFLSTSYADKLPPFKFAYDVSFMGFNLGKAKQQFHCQQQNCTLTSVAKPEGWVARFVNESTEERVKIHQTDTTFEWQSYHKTLHRRKEGKTLIKQLDLVRQQDQIYYLQGDKNWPVRPHLFDMLSVVYAIQFHALNHLSLTQFWLQDEKGQYALTFQEQEADEVDLPWQEETPTQRYHFTSALADIHLWLLPQYKFFPAQVEVYNKRTKKTIVLTLAQKPNE